MEIDEKNNHHHQIEEIREIILGEEMKNWENRIHVMIEQLDGLDKKLTDLEINIQRLENLITQNLDKVNSYEEENAKLKDEIEKIHLKIREIDKFSSLEKENIRFKEAIEKIALKLKELDDTKVSKKDTSRFID